MVVAILTTRDTGLASMTMPGPARRVRVSRGTAAVTKVVLTWTVAYVDINHTHPTVRSWNPKALNVLIIHHMQKSYEFTSRDVTARYTHPGTLFKANVLLRKCDTPGVRFLETFMVDVTERVTSLHTVLHYKR